MPLTAKGEEIKEDMEKQYGAEKGEEVFYASANKGTITGVHNKAGDVTVPDQPIPPAPTGLAPAPTRIEPASVVSGYTGSQIESQSGPGAGGFALPDTYSTREMVANSMKYGGAGRR